jgi:signal transduction histidine kinase
LTRTIAMASPLSDAVTERPTHPLRLDELLAGAHELPRWIGWRLRGLMLSMLLACAGLFMLTHWVTLQPGLPFELQATPDGLVRIHSIENASMLRLEGQVLDSVVMEPAVNPGGAAPPVRVDIVPLLLRESPRWIADPAQRQQHLALHRELDEAIEGWRTPAWSMRLSLRDAASESVALSPIGWGGVNPLYGLLCVLALLVFGVGTVVLLAEWSARNVAFALLAYCQCGQLLAVAVGAALGVLMPSALVAIDPPLRLGLDLASAAALVQLAVMHPARVQGARWFAALGWLAAVGLWAAQGNPGTVRAWWVMQGGCMALTLTAIGLMTAAQHAQPHPFVLMMRRLSLIALLTWATMSFALWRGTVRPDMQLSLANYGVMAWQVFAALAVLLSPYLSRSRPILQEFSLLAASSTVAASLDLLFVAVFSLGQFTSMTLALFFSFGLYLIIRRWVVTQLPGRESLTMERLFQRLYRIAREVEHRPDSLEASLMRLMRELYDPLEVSLATGEVGHAALRSNGSVMVVPIPSFSGHSVLGRQVLVLKHARKGQQLFSAADARLADRVMDQLHRALSFDQAVEQGRSEERLRIAQDLHDDIGARLLTLMYQAPNAESEEYIRHTIQDLKTLTRGLAAQSHTLEEAASEWKRDLSQRLNAARCDLDWHMRLDDDVVLNMVQWSALTRILRELVSNAISHAKANRVRVDLTLSEDQLTLSVEDNGLGRDPTSWSHGLGLGGVRKRTKQLGGSVRWSEVAPRGIRCEVVVEPFSGSAHPSGAQATTQQPGPDSQFSH